MQKDKMAFLDITAEICPMTFVRTKLRLEAMSSGEILELRLKGAEPLRNIPRSLAELGHVIISLDPEDKAQPEGIYRMCVRHA